MPTTSAASQPAALVTDRHREEFQADGVTQVRGAFADTWIDELTVWAERQLASPSSWVNDNNPNSATDRLFTDRYRWPEDSVIRSFALSSGVAELAAMLMQSTTARLYFDHLLVKEPGTAAATPWHQDVPYWPFLGSQITSVWVALTDASVLGSSMEFLRGSHQWDSYFAPKSFGDREDHPTSWTAQGEGEEIPDIEADRSAFDIVGFDVNAGDALVFSAWTVHGAPGNATDARRAALSTRWLGDDAVWHPHAGADPTVTDDDVCIAPGESVAGDPDRFPLGWPSR